jgi:hypothetical protein
MESPRSLERKAAALAQPAASSRGPVRSKVRLWPYT